MKKIKLICIGCAEDKEGKYQYMDELYCTECLINKLIEDEIIAESFYDEGVHGNYEED